MPPKQRKDLSNFTPEEKRQRKNALERDRRACLKAENPEAYNTMRSRERARYEANRKTKLEYWKKQQKEYRAANREVIAERDRIRREKVRKPATAAKVEEIIATFETLPEGSRQAFAILLLEVQQYQDSITERALRVTKVDNLLGQYYGH